MTSEARARLELAAIHRLLVHFGWTDLTYTHASARIPGEPEAYLIGAYGLSFDEVTPSNLVRARVDGRAAASTNRAGHAIHAAVLGARPDVRFVLHTHTRAGIAVSAMSCGLLPLSQHANVVRGTLATHPYTAPEESPEFGAALTADLADRFLMLLQNHGVLACGRTAAEAFLYLYFLQLACEVQVDVLSANQGWHEPPQNAQETLARWGAPRERPWGGTPWLALMRMLARTDATFEPLVTADE